MPSTSPHRKPVEHKQRGREIPPASAGGQERCALREGLRDAETAHEINRVAYCVALMGMLSRVYFPLVPWSYLSSMFWLTLG